jgi:hypothetical protein
LFLDLTNGAIQDLFDFSPSFLCNIGVKKVLHCAIYTRKSHEEGLEQEFNSLDAQRESTEAYIESQKLLGWKALPDRYDDGGYSGGTMERPALQRLLNNRAYIGEIVHKSKSYPGEHEAIIDRKTWGKVQAVLADNKPVKVSMARTKWWPR